MDFNAERFTKLSKKEEMTSLLLITIRFLAKGREASFSSSLLREGLACAAVHSKNVVLAHIELRLSKVETVNAQGLL